jgi:hypothetical protein
MRRNGLNGQVHSCALMCELERIKNIKESRLQCGFRSRARQIRDTWWNLLPVVQGRALINGQVSAVTKIIPQNAVCVHMQAISGGATAIMNPAEGNVTDLNRPPINQGQIEIVTRSRVTVAFGARRQGRTANPEVITLVANSLQRLRKRFRKWTRIGIRVPPRSSSNPGVL